MDDFEEKTKAFRQWLLANSVEISGSVDFHDYRHLNQGRGLIAVKDIESDELLFKIPLTAVAAVEYDKDFSKSVDTEELGPWLSLIAYLMSLQNSAKWKPYFDVLPQSFNTPMFWSSFEALKGSALVDKIGIEQAEEQYNISLKPVLELEQFANTDVSLDAFHRMGSIIMAYSFDIESEDGELIKAMVPLADTLNAHTSLCNAHLCHPENGYLEMRSIKPISQGSQVYNTYGELPNSDFLRRYGYVEAGGTDFDVVEITSSLIAKAVASEYKLPVSDIESSLERLANYEEETDAYDESYGIYDESYDIPFSGEPEQANLGLLLYLQLSAHTQYDTKQTIRQIGNLIGNDEITEEAKTIWEKAIELRLAEYPTLLVARANEEEVKITDETITDPMAMAHEIVFGEIRILNRSLQWVRGMSTVPSGPILEKLNKKRKSENNGVSSSSVKHQRT
jgi:SET domain-containing protein 6